VEIGAMRNVTLAIDDTLLERARSLAERRKTSLNAMIRSLLAAEVEQEDRIAWAKEGMRRLMDEAERRAVGDVPYQWDRRDAYGEREDRLLSRHERSNLRGFGEES
jgi:predicted transcriptional regulator